MFTRLLLLRGGLLVAVLILLGVPAYSLIPKKRIDERQVIVAAIRRGVAPGADRQQVAAFVSQQGWSGWWYYDDNGSTRTRPITDGSDRGRTLSCGVPIKNDVNCPKCHSVYVHFCFNGDGWLTQCHISEPQFFVGISTIPSGPPIFE